MCRRGVEPNHETEIVTHMAATTFSDKVVKGRLRMEMKEFSDKAYVEFRNVTQLSADTVLVTDSSDVVWRVTRTPNFFEPPHVWKNGLLVQGPTDYAPSVLSAKWLLSLMADQGGSTDTLDKTPAP